MKFRKLVSTIIIFVCGMAASAALIYYVDIPEARADQYYCIRTGLGAQEKTGNIPDPEFTIFYNVPQCFTEAGYAVKNASLYSGQVAVTYFKTSN